MRPLDPRLLRYAAAVRPYLAATVALGAITAGLVVAQAALLANAIAATFLHGADLHRLSRTLGWLVAVVVVRALVSGAQEALARTTSQRVQAQLRKRLLDKMFELGPDWLSGRRSADLALLATRGVTALDGYFSQYLPQLIMAGIVPVVVLAWILPADLIAFVTVLVTLPLIPVFMALVGLTTQERTKRQWATLQRLGHHFLDVVSGLTTLKVYGRARRQAEVVARVTDDYRRATMATLRLAFLSSLVLELLATLSVALVAVGIGLRLLSGDLDLRTALLVLILAPEAYLPLRRVGASYHASAEGLAAAEEVFAVLDVPDPDPLSRRTPSRLDAARPAGLRVDGLVVRREGRPEPVLDHLDLEVRPGEFVAVSGPSGVGKSTLLEAVLGLAATDGGTVATTGASADRVLGQIDPARWRETFAWVPQRPYVVAGTCADNVRLGAPDASDRAVDQALIDAGDLLAELPAGAATTVGDSGHGLSIGQVRRLALARALVARRPILLLDEPTAGLDAGSETRVVRTLLARSADQTVIVVSHRPVVLAAADRVVTVTRTGAEVAA